MKDYTGLPFHPTMEKVVDILRRKTQNDNPIFFRLVVSYFFSKIASMMRVTVAINDSQKLPVNMYAVNLAPSGSGKGHSISIIEEDLIGAFRQKFLEHTFPQVAEKRLAALAVKRSIRNKTKDEDEFNRAKAEFEELGQLLFSFDSGTSPALKQMRTKLLMAGAGSMNFEMDELGSNFLGSVDVLTNFLELFDSGKIKQKLIKNTRENVRSEDLVGCTPTNMLLFGTPTKLLNGSKLEDEFYDMLETGYARRCFFGFSRYRKANQNQTAQDMYNLYHDPVAHKYLATLSDRLGMLAEPMGFNKEIKMKHSVLLALYDYRIWCQNNADRMSEFEDVRRAEMSHRYFKVAKLAAVYAYIDGSGWIQQSHLENAIAMAEMSGEALNNILNRDRPYVKLAKYITSIRKELTQADLTEDLPFYKGTEQAKREMLNLAIGYGYKNGMYIRSELVDGIQFLSGRRVEETNLDKVRISYSNDITRNYKNNIVPFNKLHTLMTINGYHWVSHHLKDGYRDSEHSIPGCNLVVLDVEGSVDIPTVKLLLKDYTWLIHTTKRHTDSAHRFRIVMPLTHFVELEEKDFRQFMQNIFSWLPFNVDTQTGQRSRKWLTCKGNHWYNDGQLLDALQFVPKTKKADEHKKIVATQTNLTNLERWFINNTEEGNRNTKLYHFAHALVDMGYDLDTISSKVLDLNSKLPNPLSEAEVSATVIVTASRLVTERDTT